MKREDSSITSPERFHSWDIMSRQILFFCPEIGRDVQNENCNASPQRLLVVADWLIDCDGSISDQCSIDGTSSDPIWSRKHNSHVACPSQIIFLFSTTMMKRMKESWDNHRHEVYMQKPCQHQHNMQSSLSRPQWQRWSSSSGGGITVFRIPNKWVILIHGPASLTLTLTLTSHIIKIPMQIRMPIPCIAKRITVVFHAEEKIIATRRKDEDSLIPALDPFSYKLTRWAFGGTNPVPLIHLVPLGFDTSARPAHHSSHWGVRHLKN